jgi:hypothetical protein
MGCSIHLHTEIKVGGKWHHYSHPQVKSDYRLFALMADVRNEDGDYTPLCQPKGLPADASFTTRWDSKRWRGDGHSHSWFSAQELVQLEAAWEALLGEDFDQLRDGLERFAGYVCGNSWAGFTRYPEDRPKDLEDVRWCFWFDN